MKTKMLTHNVVVSEGFPQKNLNKKKTTIKKKGVTQSLN